jgi:pimeloyl-ACP methyl ester carboxylesterase
MSSSSVFKTPKGEAAYLAAYNAAMKLWPVSYEEINIATRFGMTHVVLSGPKDAPPLVLLHGYLATLLMWLPNIADFSRDFRVYAIDVMGEPSKSIPDEPIGSASDYVAWLTATLNGLHLDRISLAGCSFGGWLALTYTVAVPDRVEKLALLSPGGFLPIAKQFSLRGMLMVFVPTRLTVNSFMHWAGFTDSPGDTNARRVLDLMYLGTKHFRMPNDTLRVAAVPLSDDQLQAMLVPVLLLMGDHEVIYDAATALARARRLIPNFQGELLPRCSHDMAFSQHRIVDARVLDFLKETRADDRGAITERSVA